MSFGSGGFGGFGSNSNTQSTFGGFGSNNNNSSGGVLSSRETVDTARPPASIAPRSSNISDLPSAFSGFGSNTNTSGSIFGGSNNNTGGGVFGSNNNTSSPFGSGGGFGTNNSATSFGSKPFGGSTGGGLFGGGGGSTSGTTFGGFGSTNNNSTTATTFGGGNTGGSIFGQNKSTGFGSTNNATGSTSLFGGGSTSGGFGTNTASGFGSSTSGGFGANANTNNGTAGTPFQAFTEKDPGSTNASSQYQTITFQQPYSNFSLEELRVVDYAQGRRYGNQNGQAGAFGQSTGFGGFGTNNNTSTSFGSSTNTGGGGLFGNQNNTTTTFGSNTNSGFGNGNANSGGLFGQNKTGGGLFGSSTTQAGTTGGLFGSTNNTSNTFGSGGTGFGASTTGTGGGLFGQSQTQNKPLAFGGFGNTSSTTNTTPTPFGGGGSSNAFGQSNTGGGLFGQNPTSATSGFGSNTQTSNTGGGLFGNSTGGAFGQNQQNQNQNQTQTQTSGGLFGGGFGQNNQTQQKPGGLFGSSTANTGTSLFGNTQSQPQPQAQTGGLFSQNKTGGLFGQSTTGQPNTGGLFSGSTTNTGNTGGGLFGNLGTQNPQQNPGTSLFGGSTNQPKPGGLFGGSTATNTNTGGGLFSNLGQSNNNAAPLGNSLFGNQAQQQTNQQPLNNSLFGASGNSLLQTSMNTNPYGNDSLFAGLNTPMQSPGPLATPLSSSQKNKRSSILPQHKLNPSQSNRLLTPQGKRAGGYGFTYSTYGTPNSAQSSPLNGSMFSGGSLSRQLGKSMSTSNLRNSFSADTSILAPGAFSMTGRSYGTGSLKKLNLNRALNQRPALFEDSSATKRVSFAAPSPEHTPNSTTVNGASSSALVVREEPEDASPGGSSTTINGTTGNGLNGQSSRVEMEQVNGSESTPVPKDRSLAPRTSASLNIQNGQTIDPMAGSYYTYPSMEELRNMSKYQLKSVANFVVGRDKVGKIEFNMGKPVDLSDVPLNKLFGDIVALNHRNATVYGEACSVVKPQLGSGLNHPSRITMGNSWPRGANRQTKASQKHVERLRRVTGTEFEEYRMETGEWIFKVPHFSSYGFDYDDPDDQESSELSPVPETPAQLGNSQMSNTPQDDSIASASQSSPDDTFDFKRGMRKRANVPGQFGDEAAYEEDEEMGHTQGESFLGERSVGSLDGQHDYIEASESDSVDDQDMANSVSGPARTTEQDVAKQPNPFKDSVKPKSILKASQVLRPTMGTPSKGPTVFDDDWANALQRTISPRKQDRLALRESQGDALRERGNNTTNLAQSFGAGNMKTTMSRMDLMDSLFGETDRRKDSTTKRFGRGIQFPYAKRPKTANDLDQLRGADKDFHNCNKPHFGETGILVYAGKGVEGPSDDIYYTDRASIAGAEKDIRFKKLPTFANAVPPTVYLQKEHTQIFSVSTVSKAKLRTEPDTLEFSQLADAVPLGTAAGTQEHQAWQLLSLLFDGGKAIPHGMSAEEYDQTLSQDRKERLSQFWQSLVFEDAQNHAKEASTPEEKAIAYLSCNSISDACEALFRGSDIRLATMVSQIGGDTAMRQDMTSQIEEWRRMDVLADMEEPIRALYELISGNCAQADGKVGAGRENKASSFKIASRFGLDWRRAFGLRLWYGIMADEPIELAIAQFADALRDGKEDVKPVPWFTEQGLNMGWDDPQEEHREDLLWGILKLYASSKLQLPANVEDILAPECVSGNPLNARLSFQLFQVLYSRRNDENEDEDRQVDMPCFRGLDGGARYSFLSSTNSQIETDQAEDALEELGDKLTLTYAASLHTPEHWTTAAWVYIHLSSSTMRAHYIRSLLTQFSNTYEIADSDPIFDALMKLDIPEQWIHAAAALQAKTEGNALRQATHLIKANELQEAHEVLCRSVGPDAIISRDHDPLRELMGGFLGTPPSSPTSEHDHVSGGKTKEPVPGWIQGGQIYFDYVELHDLTDQRVGYRVDEELNERINDLCKQLQQSLEKVLKNKWDGVSLEERVALSEIAGVVANLMVKNKVCYYEGRVVLK
ncbi:hypothetical protein N0V90_007249 [Kalmusia sp. IMI 367209]|nr:hypothetical protein N0V90_007249 [Kalmusia sp. IMI 367209]